MQSYLGRSLDHRELCRRLDESVISSCKFITANLHAARLAWTRARTHLLNILNRLPRNTPPGPLTSSSIARPT